MGMDKKLFQDKETRFNEDACAVAKAIVEAVDKHWGITADNGGNITRYQAATTTKALLHSAIAMVKGGHGAPEMLLSAFLGALSQAFPGQIGISGVGNADDMPDELKEALGINDDHQSPGFLSDIKKPKTVH